MKEYRAYIKHLRETGDLGDAIGMLLIGVGGYIGMILITGILG